MKYKRIITETESDEIKIKPFQLIDLEYFEPKKRSSGVLKNKAIFLPAYIAGEFIDEWIIAQDVEQNLCAIPLRK